METMKEQSEKRTETLKDYVSKKQDMLEARVD